MEKSPEKVIFDQIVEMCKKTEQSVKNVLSNVLDKLILENEYKPKGDKDGDSDSLINSDNFFSKMEGMKVNVAEECKFYSYTYNLVFQIDVKVLKRKGMTDKYISTVTIREKNEFYREESPVAEKYVTKATRLEETYTPELALGNTIKYLKSKLPRLEDNDRTLTVGKKCTKEELEKEFNNVIDDMIKFYSEEVSNKEVVDDAK